MDKGAWWAMLHGVAKSWTWLSDSHNVCIMSKKIFQCIDKSCLWEVTQQLVPIILWLWRVCWVQKLNIKVNQVCPICIWFGFLNKSTSKMLIQRSYYPFIEWSRKVSTQRNSDANYFLNHTVIPWLVFWYVFLQILRGFIGTGNILP